MDSVADWLQSGPYFLSDCLIFTYESGRLDLTTYPTQRKNNDCCNSLIIKVLDDEGVTLLAYDDELSSPEFPEGSIEWTEFYESRKIGEKTGFSPKMYAYVDVSGVGITSIVNSASIAYDSSDPKGFVAEVKQTMEKFYLSL